MADQTKTFGDFWKILYWSLKEEDEMMDTFATTALERLLNAKLFLKLQKAAWATTGTESQLSLDGARETSRKERAEYAIRWAKRFGLEIKMSPKLSEFESPLVETAYEYLAERYSKRLNITAVPPVEAAV